LVGNGAHGNVSKRVERGLTIIALPKTIDNGVWGTDVTFGFGTAMSIASEAIDRLHTMAQSHLRIIVEIEGHNAGWLALGAGVAGEADAILSLDIPYDVESAPNAVLQCSRAGKQVSTTAMANGAHSIEERAITADGRKKQKKALEAVPARGRLQRGGTPAHGLH
jgi:6-phosphofructokinase 1